MKKSILTLALIFTLLNASSQIFSVGNGDGFASISIGAPGNLTPLPIEILTFNAKCNHQKVVLNWSATTHLDNDYFTIERTVNGIDFEIAETMVAEGSGQINNYVFTDDNAISSALKYRLKMYSADGKLKNLLIEPVTCATNHDLNIYPNPSQGIFVIDGSSLNGQIIIKNLLGQIVYQTEISSEKQEIDLRNQETGVYVIQIESEFGSQSKKIILTK